MNIPVSLDFSKLAEDLKQSIFKDKERYNLLPNCDFYGENARCLASHINKYFMTKENSIEYNDVRLVIHRFATNKLIGYVYLDTDENVALDKFIANIRVDIADDSDNYVYNEILLINIKAVLKAMQDKYYNAIIDLFHEITKYIYRTATPDANQDAIIAVTLYIDFMYNYVFSGMEMPHTYANKVYRTLLDTNFCDYRPVIDAITTLHSTNACVYFIPLIGDLLREASQKPYYTEEIGKGMAGRVFNDERYELVVPMLVKEHLQKSSDERLLEMTLAHAPSLLAYIQKEENKEDRDVLVKYIKEKVDAYIKDHPELADFKGFENNDKASYKPNGNFIVPNQKLNTKAILKAKQDYLTSRIKKK